MSNQNAQGGLWNAARPVISTETQNLLKGLSNMLKINQLN